MSPERSGRRPSFRQWRQVIEDNGWQGRMAQALADEPQTYNDKTYRVLAGGASPAGSRAPLWGQQALFQISSPM